MNKPFIRQVFSGGTTMVPTPEPATARPTATDRFFSK